MKDWQYNLQINRVNKYDNWVDNTGVMDDFDLEPSNVVMEETEQRA
jgi:hypothetical protein